MKKLGYILVILIILVVAVIVALKYSGKIDLGESVLEVKEKEVEVDLEQLRKDYSAKADEALSGFWAKKDEITGDDVAANLDNVKGTMDSLLELKLVSDDKENHLDMVLTLAELEDVYGKVVKGEKTYDEVKNTIADLEEKIKEFNIE